MGTLKSQKLKEDEYRLMLENGIKALLSSQKQVVAELKKLTKALEGKTK